MIFLAFADFEPLYPADEVEQALPDVETARKLFSDSQSNIPRQLLTLVRQIGFTQSADTYLDAATLACARLAKRHGSLGDDFHAYHNENHVLSLACQRLPRLMHSLGKSTLKSEDWGLLLLFAAGHDLRQRESPRHQGPAGADEAASAAEMSRIMKTCGFDPKRDTEQFQAVQMSIVGSTFGAGPTNASAVDPEPRLRKGCFAKHLSTWLDRNLSGWRANAGLQRSERLARLCADLDTGNVADPYAEFVGSAANLCREREYRAEREARTPAAIKSCIDFLTRGQMQFFFEAHQFSSREGKNVFGPGKVENAARIRAHVHAFEQDIARQAVNSAEDVIQCFLSNAENRRSTV